MHPVGISMAAAASVALWAISDKLRTYNYRGFTGFGRISAGASAALGLLVLYYICDLGIESLKTGGGVAIILSIIWLAISGVMLADWISWEILERRMKRREIQEREEDEDDIE